MLGFMKKHRILSIFIGVLAVLILVLLGISLIGQYFLHQTSAYRLYQLEQGESSDEEVVTWFRDAAAIPEDCGFCLYYGVQVENRKIRAVEFQGVRDGRALIKGSGPSDAEGNLTYAAVAAYAKAYMKEAEADAQERSHQKEAPGI